MTTSPLPRYAWPGGYPIIYIDPANADILCADCAWPEVCDDVPLVQDVHWEGPDESCANCATAIPSAYGDPDA